MNKKEYYKISEDKKLPLRCPCLATCSRYRYTALYIGMRYYQPKYENVDDNMKEMGILNESESLSKMLEAGEPTVFIGGNSSYGIYNACPEFFLHPHEHKPCDMGSFGVHEMSFDEYYHGDKFRPGEPRHYTECPEYSIFITRRVKSNIRKSIPAKIKAELQKEISSQCPFCRNDDVGHFHIHHIDECRDNNNYGNLIMVCPICHSKITKGDISINDVITLKSRLATNNKHS